MLALFLALTACDLEPLACDEYAASSVALSVVGPDGAPIVAEITAVDADGNDVDVQCLDESEECTQFVVGWEVSGEITISGSATDACNMGTGEVVVDVPMDEDGCHVVSQTAVLEITDWTDLDCG